ncbi:MAG: hypothetical protein K1X28_04140 [Parachlamydiales bacterium]|nr:hypothetical protein [Parachlamydiales bacterium]
MSRDICIDFAKVSMGAALLIADSQDGAHHPYAADCARLRGFKMEKFLSWADRISKAFHEKNGSMDLLIQESLKSFRKKRIQRPEEIPQLTALCARVNEFLDQYRHH